MTPTNSRIPLLAALCLTSLSCGDAASRPSTDEGGGLVQVTRIELEELPGDPIVGVEHLARRPDGGYVLADRHADRVRLFDATGRQEQTLGRSGEGPGELQEPSGAAELQDGRVVVVERGSPRLTVFRPDSAPEVARLSGQYGFWVEEAAGGLVAGVATRDTRFATLTSDGSTVTAFGHRDPSVATTPFWIYFATEHAAVLGDIVAVSTSLFPTIRLFSVAGDSIGAFDVGGSDWIQASAPPVADLSAPGNRGRIADWSRTFTVVRGLAALDDSLLLVEYGRYDPSEADPYFIEPTGADLYALSGERLLSRLELPGPVVGGGQTVLVLVGSPPAAWEVAELAWRPPTGP